MKLFRLFLFLLLFIITTAGACGCMKKYSNKSNRKENDQDYAVLMQDYIQNKYSIKVNVIETIFPKEGINTGLKYNILVFCDEKGITANVKARMSSPYSFYDDYVEASVAYKIQSELSIDITTQDCNAKIYVAVNNKDYSKLDISPANIASLSFISTIAGEPDDRTIEELYEVYTQIQSKKYDNVYFLVGFTDGSAEFEQAVNNYMIYGKSEWKDYTGEVYSELYVTENNLTFEEFKSNLSEC